VGAMIDVKGGMIAFKVSNEIVGFGMETVNRKPYDFSCCMLDAHVVQERSLTSSTQHALFDAF